jgi:Zn-dependent peptidase ImmA (M78 family)
MELDGKMSPQAIASEIVRQNPALPIPVPIEEIAKASGILEIKELTSDGFEGMLLSNIEKSEGIVFVNKNRPWQRQRFTIGHELGHFLLPSHRQLNGDALRFQCTPKDMQTYSSGYSDLRLEWEVQANEFSAEMLMPRSRFREQLKRKNEPNLQHLNTLATNFNTSVEATARRYLALNDHPIAMVFSHHKHIRYTWKSPEFHYYLDVKKGSPIPKGSPSLEGHADDSLTDFDSIDSYLWVSSERGPRPPENILEQTLYQRDGYKITLLYVDEAEED